MGNPLLYSVEDCEKVIDILTAEQPGKKEDIVYAVSYTHLWKASDEQLKTSASLHAQITREKGAACTEFVCDNAKLQSFVADQLDNSEKQTYTQNMKEVHEASATDGKDVVLKEHKLTSEQTVRKNRVNGVIAGSLVVITFIGLVVLLKRRKKNK